MVTVALSGRVLSKVESGYRSSSVATFESSAVIFNLPHLNALARADLELPLGGHDLCVGSRDLDTGEKAAPVVCLDDVALDNFLRKTSVHCSWTWSWEDCDGQTYACADTTVVWALRSGESSKLVSSWTESGGPGK